MKKILALVFSLALIVHAEITVACAANMQFALTDIIAAYQTSTGKIVKPVFGSSGKLSAQIQNGAPFDVFVSADMDYVDKLFQKGYTQTSAKEYARGKLVLWTIHDFDLTQGIAILKSPAIKSIAVGDPKVTIYGPAALQVLEKAGILAEVKPKIVYGDNITTVAQYIVNGSADIGFANLSFSQSGPMAGKGHYLVLDSTLYNPLPQGAAILHYGATNNAIEAKAFFDFLFSTQSREILKKHGYALPSN
jgi:molybdate transport system substrate-binding protein